MTQQAAGIGRSIDTVRAASHCGNSNCSQPTTAWMRKIRQQLPWQQSLAGSQTHALSSYWSSAQQDDLISTCFSQILITNCISNKKWATSDTAIIRLAKLSIINQNNAVLQQHSPEKTHTSQTSRTTQVSRYEKGKINLDFTGARDSECQWHQLGHMQVCTSLQTDNHASNPPLIQVVVSNKQKKKIKGSKGRL